MRSHGKEAQVSDTPMTDRRVIRQDPRMCGCCYKSEITYADFARRLERELTSVTEQRDSAFRLIEYAGELLGVTPQDHKSAHGFKVLQSIKDLIEQAKGGASDIG